MIILNSTHRAAIAQLGERQTEDLEVPGSIPGLGIFSSSCILTPSMKSISDWALRKQKIPRPGIEPGSSA